MPRRSRSINHGVRSKAVVMGHPITLESDVVCSGATSDGPGASLEDLACFSSTETFRPWTTRLSIGSCIPERRAITIDHGLGECYGVKTVGEIEHVQRVTRCLGWIRAFERLAYRSLWIQRRYPHARIIMTIFIKEVTFGLAGHKFPLNCVARVGSCQHDSWPKRSFPPLAPPTRFI